LNEVIDIGKRILRKCSADDIFNSSAALAYYIIFAIAPIVYVIAWISSFFLDEALHTIIADVLTRLSTYLGDSSIDQIEIIMQKILFDPGNMMFNLIMLGIVMFFATSIFSSVRRSLNKIWSVEPSAYSVRTFFKNRIAAILILACMAIILVFISFTRAFIGGLENYLTGLFPLLEGYVGLMTSTSIEFIAAAILFTTMFKLLPDARIPNRAVILGAVFTSGLFVLGKFLMGLYLTSSFYGSIYDAIGSVIVIVLWFYYIALIFYLGAEFTYAISTNVNKDGALN